MDMDRDETGADDETWAGRTEHETDPDQRSEKRANLEDKGERQTRAEESAGLGEAGGVSHAGRSGGRLPTDIGSEDEGKRGLERPAGATRVTKSDEA